MDFKQHLYFTIGSSLFRFKSIIRSLHAEDFVLKVIAFLDSLNSHVKFIFLFNIYTIFITEMHF